MDLSACTVSTQTRHSKTTTLSVFAGTNPMRKTLRQPQL